ncbi:DNA-directed RNA polymerase subunit A' [Candidatus Micrarchaeota archaeon]|nr:DNA-directed RNA polymerase subunit A' [Candidatus Micrarchaeota archaeon]
MTIQKKLDRVKFSIFSPEMIRKMSAAKIIIPDTYDDDGYPIDGGLVDTRLGIVDPGLRCKTCGGRVKECPGHFGHIELIRPVIHVEFAKNILFTLRSTCLSCHRITTSKSQLQEIVKEVEKEAAEEPPIKVSKGKSEVAYAATEDSGVPALDSPEPLAPQEKKAEEKPKRVKKEPKQSKKCQKCGFDLIDIKLLKPTTFTKGKETMLPSEIRDWLAAIPDDDLRELGFDPVYSRPEWMILTVLAVPPVNVRPSITLETGERSEDDLTHKLVDIIRINQKLEANINAGAPQLIIEDLWELLQYHIVTYFNNETANIPPARHRSGRPLKTLAQRLKGKEGRFRYNLSGKRVNFSARTVISPDPSISMNEVGVPKTIAEELTVPMSVTDWNLDSCKTYIMSPEYPRAIYILRSDGKRLKVGDTEELRKQMAEDLKVGWIIERQLVDKDIALFNRQPSLHRISMMAHEVRVLPGKTFKLNPVVVSPYNADFDGDEMNLHIIQTEEAQAEARYLMKVEGQILSPRHGHAIIKPQEDHVSGLYFLTKDDTEFTKEDVSNILYRIGITELPESDCKGGKYSGKMIFSLLLPSDINAKIKSKLGEEIVIQKGKLLKGAIESRAIESELLEKIFILHGPEYTRKFLDTVTILALEVISMSGLSVSLKSYSLSKKAPEELKKLTDKLNREIDNLIIQYKNKTLERSPGLSLKDTLEGLIMQATAKAREDVGRLVEEDLSISNPSIIMAKIGARGSLLNAIQMSAIVAQQAVRSKRLARGYRGRTLPYFKPGVLTGKERGFVFSSFRKGLTPYEFIHHAMGGREALVNTAIRTARSGYMQRRLINALQDLIVYPDLTVRNADLSIVQFVYGGDGKDPVYATKAEVADFAKQDDVDTA